MRDLMHELEAARHEAALYRRAYRVALEDGEHWKTMWEAKLAESEHRWCLYCAAVNKAVTADSELERIIEDRDHYQAAFHDAYVERDALAELVTALRADLYMARERG